ncbi:MAG: glycosyltransferase [Rhodomicrobium sp.]
MNGPNPHVLQATAWYPPYHSGGTEVYLESLIAELDRKGVHSTVLAPRRLGVPQTYGHGSAFVETYAFNEPPLPAEMREGRPHLGFGEFKECLRANKGAIYHQHAWTRGCGPHHLRAAREMGFPTALTIHVAGNICLRGTMLKFGKALCNGVADQRVCGACWAHGRGIPSAAANFVSNLPIEWARKARRSPSRVGTAVGARALGEEQEFRLREMIGNADRIICVSQWLYEALLANGAPRNKLVLSRQGIARLEQEPHAGARERLKGPGPLRLLYLGRWDRIKGIEIAVRAVKALPEDIPVRLSIYALTASAWERDHEARVRSIAGKDPRIVFELPVSRSEITRVAARHHVLIVPSVCMETGPLVVLEAQAAGLYVLGSRLGGIAELVTGSDAGMLVEPGDAGAWAKAIKELWTEYSTHGLPRPSKPPRTMEAAAADMIEVYRELAPVH